MKNHLRTIVVLVWIGLMAGLTLADPVTAQGSGTQKILTLTADGPVTPAMANYIERGLARAEDESAQLVILQLNTPGGQISVMTEIVELIRGSSIPVVVYVTPNGAMAASAGTIITLAGHANAMAPETTIGAASPVGSQGEDIGTTEEAKVKEIMRATVRSLAASRPPEAIKLAEDTIENAKAVSSTEALAIGLTDFIATDVNDLIRQLDGTQVVVNHQEITLETRFAQVDDVPLTLVEQALLLLTNPNIVFLLLSIGVQAILIEISSPGGWVAGFIGVICVALVVYSFGILPINLFGLLFIVLAFALFIIEVKTHTGGAMTIAGVLSFVAGALILFNSVRVPGFALVSVPLVIGTGIILALTFLFIVSFALRALRIPASMGKVKLIGQTGVVRNVINPSGSVQVGGELWSAESITPEEVLVEGTLVQIMAVEGLRLKVKPLDRS